MSWTGGLYSAQLGVRGECYYIGRLPLAGMVVHPTASRNAMLLSLYNDFLLWRPKKRQLSSAYRSPPGQMNILIEAESKEEFSL